MQGRFFNTRAFVQRQDNTRSGCLLSHDASPSDQLNIRVKVLLSYNIGVSRKGGIDPPLTFSLPRRVENRSRERKIGIDKGHFVPRSRGIAAHNDVLRNQSYGYESLIRYFSSIYHYLTFTLDMDRQYLPSPSQPHKSSSWQPWR
jgi:hypothetical protein